MKVQLEGWRETEAALADLGKSLGKSVLRRVGIRALGPMAEDARAKAPNDPETPESIAGTIIVTTRRPAGAKSAAARAYAATIGAGGGVAAARAAAKGAGAGAVEVFMGPNRDPKAVQQEFGNSRHGPQPFMRPAFAAGAEGALDAVATDLGAEIEKTARRRAARLARAAAKAG
ncbi:hypothetical protein [uncultured Zoogloea sp.]|uniref:hypothetical protein n=1 Tax=uncultured Zoogloea sp. TaxID=160237 RepID=UPI00262D250A|nr:hypothetical protein [uncultured Zoogloea sp.]